MLLTQSLAGSTLTSMIEDELPLRRREDHAHLLASESLDSYSIDELDQRIALLQREISRCQQHRSKTLQHRQEADKLFSSRKD